MNLGKTIQHANAADWIAAVGIILGLASGLLSAYGYSMKVPVLEEKVHVQAEAMVGIQHDLKNMQATLDRIEDAVERRSHR